MSKTGPKPVPTQLKELRGTAKDTDNEARFPVPNELPEPPEIFNEWAVSAWNHYGNLLLEAGLFTEGDQMALEMLCNAYGRWIEAELALAEEGTVLESEKTGGKYMNPTLHVANKAWDQIRKILAEFGLTPAERTRVAALGAEKKDDLTTLLFSGIGDN